MMQTVNNYEVVGKATTERGGKHISYALKLLYRGDGTPWWTCSSSFEWPCSEDFFNASSVGDLISVSLNNSKGAGSAQ